MNRVGQVGKGTWLRAELVREPVSPPVIPHNPGAIQSQSLERRHLARARLAAPVAGRGASALPASVSFSLAAITGWQGCEACGFTAFQRPFYNFEQLLSNATSSCSHGNATSSFLFFFFKSISCF